ncbi:MAG: HNH endonuclease [Gordonia sp. (in: high G+C Gram-positive bacteria)]|uniref:HNH endonuclease n=1 Tax=Gordonia sp. (in: high G+C Gram-positive bacteria) TaxID=84139 RepID=UPI003C74300C
MTSRSPSSELGRDWRYQQAKARYRRDCAAVSAPCWLCTEPIDYTLKYPDDRSWSLDHKTPVSDDQLGQQRALDPGNFRPSHLDCNQERGNRDPTLGLGAPSETW